MQQLRDSVHWDDEQKIALIELKNPRWVDLAEKPETQMLFAGESIKNK